MSLNIRNVKNFRATFCARKQLALRFPNLRHHAITELAEVDFFGKGPRIPRIAVSPYSTGGHVSHVYGEHSSFVKFVERNWMLGATISDRNRDNLRNPAQGGDHYVPRNMPAIGDLFDQFNLK